MTTHVIPHRFAPHLPPPLPVDGRRVESRGKAPALDRENTLPTEALTTILFPSLHFAFSQTKEALQTDN